MKKAAIFSLILLYLIQSGLGQEVSFSGHLLYQSPVSRVFSVSTGDLDKDNNTDILFTEPDHDLLQWFRNETNNLFSLHEIGAYPAIGAIVVDFDLDQDMDVLACSYTLNQVVFFENDGSQVFTMHVISAAVQHPLMLACNDLDKDNDLDIVCATQDAGTGMVLLRNEGNLNFTYLQLSAQSYSSTWAAIIDLDQDNDMDILGNNFMASGGLLWYEQTAPSTFTEHLVPYPWVHGGAAGDIDSDGDIDLAGAACGSSFAWFENNGTNTFTKHALPGTSNCPVHVEITDINKDGHNDIAGVSWGSSKIYWWQNDGNEVFTMHLICDTLVNPSGLCVADLNHDSLPDVVAGSYSRKLDWFENKGVGTGITVQKDKLPFDIQRDPVTGDIIINPEINNSSPYEVQLVDALGRICFSAISGASRLNIHTKQFQPGIYLLRVLSSGKQYTVKLYLE
ncbi:MAG: FG-GAP-like repeat-containing protein [Bacteroidetes bacterium]|nr:FG-GAP-like repeat-containing protein [Bacteroidota bacterium]